MSSVRRLFSLDQWRENFGIAIDALRASKMRSGLTMLGVVIGVATVMTMATIVQGISDQILNAIKVAGPTTFYLVKVFSQTPVNPDRLPKYIRIRPNVSDDEAALIARLPQIQYAAIWAQIQARLEYKGVRTRPIAVFGADDRYQEIQGGELTDGRWFTKAEMRSGAAVAVLDQAQAWRIFGRESPLGKLAMVGGRPVTIIGLYQAPQNIFSPPGTEIGAIMPYLFVDHGYKIDKTNALWIPIKPRAGVTVAEAEDIVTAAIREYRKLRPTDKNTFDVITQDQILDTFTSITDIFFFIMLVLASVALMVGGIGVMAIMMVSVTARTREIGVRKAIGARNRDIRLQFLIESVTLSCVGGAVGVLGAFTFSWLIRTYTPLPADFPLWAPLLAFGICTVIGVFFGVHPARKAARLNPIEALRSE